MRSRTLGTPAHDPSSSQASALLVVPSMSAAECRELLCNLGERRSRPALTLRLVVCPSSGSLVLTAPFRGMKLLLGGSDCPARTVSSADPGQGPSWENADG
jgi:hypothetical protein